jgi:hypothetical protein
MYFLSYYDRLMKQQNFRYAMRQPIIIPIFSHTEETIKLRDMEMPYSMSECEVADVYFFNINAVMRDDETDYALILSNGENYLSPLTVEEVLDLIQKGNMREICRG